MNVEAGSINAQIFPGARLCVMLYIGEIKFSVWPGRLLVLWEKDTSHNACGITSTHSHGYGQTEKSFNVIELGTIGNIQASLGNQSATHGREAGKLDALCHYPTLLFFHRSGHLKQSPKRNSYSTLVFLSLPLPLLSNV